jgi:hypothetical protein
MRRIRLTATEQAHAEHLFKTPPDRRDRCQAILMASRRRKRQNPARHIHNALSRAPPSYAPRQVAAGR